MKIYGVAGTNEQHIAKQLLDKVEMPDTRPSEFHICQDNGDGTGTWVLDADKKWEKEIAEFDSVMPRWAEDIWDYLGIENAPLYVQDVYNEKKAKREEKPK